MKIILNFQLKKFSTINNWIQDFNIIRKLLGYINKGVLLINHQVKKSSMINPIISFLLQAN